MRKSPIWLLSLALTACIADSDDLGQQEQNSRTKGSSSGPCPAGVVCVNDFPFRHVGNTSTASSDVFDRYGCSNHNESGNETIYRLEVPSPGFVTARLPSSAMAPGVDVDVHLLGSLNANDCLDRGHWQLGQLVPAGTYYLTADTFTTGEGNELDGKYTLEIGLVTVDDLERWGMDGDVAYDALHVFDEAWSRGQVETSAYGVVDLAMHASERRMWVFDMFDGALAYQTYTTVGEASDPDGNGWADSFSNVSGSHQSSLGLMKGGAMYSGQWGRSMRMDGLESGYNDRVRSRAIVLHAWNGSAPSFVNANRSTGAERTWGCLGIDPNVVDGVRSYLSNGGLLLSHYPDGHWSRNSRYLP